MDGAASKDDDIAGMMAEIGQKARDAARHLAKTSTLAKNAALMAAAESIGTHAVQIKAANAKDIAAAREKNLPVEGLMCIPPAADDAAPHFALLAKLARDNGLQNLSMGMSGDFELAVKFGATHVRVGTAIFGTRAVDDQTI